MSTATLLTAINHMAANNIVNYSRRPAQVSVINEINIVRKEAKKILTVLSTGGGKTIIAAHIIAELLGQLYPGFNSTKSRAGWRSPVDNPLKAPKQILFVVHRDKLAKQSLKKFRAVFASRFAHEGMVDEKGMEHGITLLKSGKKYDFFMPIVIVSQQSLKKARFQRMLRDGTINPAAVFFDEAHTTAANPAGRALMAEVESMIELMIGLTATPFWLDKTVTASQIFDAAVVGPSYGELVRTGQLVQSEYLEPDYPEQEFEEYMDHLSGTLKTREVECRYETDKQLDYVVAQYRKNQCVGLKTIVFAKNVDHAEKIRKAFDRGGLRSEVVSYEVEKEEKIRIFTEYETWGSDLDIIISIDELGVGYDYIGIQCVILLRPTESLVTHWQQMGRGSRVCDEPWLKKMFCKILDFVKNIKRHGDYGIPDTVVLTPSSVMNRKPRKKREGMAPTKICEKCKTVNPAGIRKCINNACEHEFPLKKVFSENHVIPGDMHRIYTPGMQLDDGDRIAYFRSLRAKRWARLQNPNACILDYRDSLIGSEMPIPGLDDPEELRNYTMGTLTGRPDCEATAKKFAADLCKKRRLNPTRWSDSVVFSLIYLEFNEAVGNATNMWFLTNKLSDLDKFDLVMQD